MRPELHFRDERPRRPKPMTSEDFLAWEIRQEERYEFVDGRIVAMSGANLGHQQIAGNALLALRSRLRGGPCRALHDLKIRIPGGSWRYADVGVDCGPPDPKALFAGEPRLTLEVESPSTTFLEEADRLEDYQSVPSIAHVLILAQNKPRARLYTRAGAGWTHADVIGLEHSVPLSALGIELPMAELFEGVAFPEA